MRWFVRAADIAATLVIGSALPACTLIYDAGDFRNRVAIEVDVEPATLFEGQGSAGRKIPLVLLPDNPADGLEPDAELEFAVFAGDQLVEDGAGIELAAPSVSANGDMMATAISVPVMPELGDGSGLTVLLTIVESDRKIAGELKIGGLNELVDPRPGEVLFPVYSAIEFTQDVNFFAQPELVRFRATASITVGAKVSADAQGQRAGAGGCDGGGAEAAGGCGPHGGKPGTTELLQPNGGGGGGSNRTPGSAASGATGGAAGEPVVNEGVASLEQSRGNGGGGGADGDLVGGGGAGGGGGGVIELSSEGTLEITGNGVITANGGDGAEGQGGGGRGGGGSGGVILVRAAGALTAALGLRFAVDGGNRDEAGSGGDGFVRVDSFDESLALPAGAVRGAMWMSDELPPIVREEVITAKLFGERDQIVRVLVGDALPVDVQLAAGLTDVSLSLEPGLNTLCVVMTTTANPASPEAKNCIDVAYVPEQSSEPSAAR